MVRLHLPGSPRVKRTARRVLFSSMVVVSFIAYSFHKPFANTNPGVNQLSPTPVLATATPTPFAPVYATAVPLQENAPPPAATQFQSFGKESLSTAPTAPRGQYQDGSYTGSEVVGLYGHVQVQVTVKNQKIDQIEFLQYPNNRRTSIQINSTAMPALEQEAVGSQSARVDVVTGATLTSKAFTSSLQTALNQARY
jgi:uncharacterized protein with FMN-binding domain